MPNLKAKLDAAVSRAKSGPGEKKRQITGRRETISLPTKPLQQIKTKSIKTEIIPSKPSSVEKAPMSSKEEFKAKKQALKSGLKEQKQELKFSKKEEKVDRKFVAKNEVAKAKMQRKIDKAKTGPVDKTEKNQRRIQNASAALAVLGSGLALFKKKED
jgi:hypothetical protein